MGAGLEDETGAAPAAFVGLLIRPLLKTGAVVWVMRRDDLHAPGLGESGLPDRTADPGQGSRRGRGAVGAGGRPGHSRRRRRHRRGRGAGAEGRPPPATGLREAGQFRGAAASTALWRSGGQASRRCRVRRPFSRWRIAGAPSQPPPDTPGLGPPRWRVELERCRGGRPGGWILESSEAGHGPHPFRLVSQLADHDVATAEPGLRRVG
jgi:protein ImuA